MQTTIPKSEFTPKASHYCKQVQLTGHELIITDRGNPVVKIVPIESSQFNNHKDPEEILQSLRGTVTKFIDPLEPVGIDDWDALK